MKTRAREKSSNLAYFVTSAFGLSVLESHRDDRTKHPLKSWYTVYWPLKNSGGNRKNSKLFNTKQHTTVLGICMINKDLQITLRTCG